MMFPSSGSSQHEVQAVSPSTLSLNSTSSGDLPITGSWSSPTRRSSHADGAGPPSLGSAPQVLVTGEIECPAIPFGDQAKVVALCSIQAPRIEGSERATRAPLSVCAVLDCSSSMRDHGKLELLKETMLFVVDQMKAGDRLGIVVFQTVVSVQLPLTHMNPSGKKKAQLAIQDMKAEGRTNLSGGLFEALRLLSERSRGQPDLPACWLLTDGVANEGLAETMVPKAASKYLQRMDAPCALYTFGFGSRHNSRLLRDIADVGRGMYYYVADCELIRQAFAVCLGGLASIVAQNIRVRLTVEPPAQFIALLNSYKVDNKDSGWVTIPLGDLYSEERRDILVQLQVPALKEAVTDPATVCRWEVDYFDVLSCAPVGDVVQCTISRPAAGTPKPPIPRALDIQRNRLLVVRSMDKARTAAAENLSEARGILDTARKRIAASDSANAPEVQQMLADLAQCELHLLDQSEFSKSGKKTLDSLSLSYSLQRATVAGTGNTAQFRTSAQMKTLALADCFQLLIKPGVPQDSTIPALPVLKSPLTVSHARAGGPPSETEVPKIHPKELRRREPLGPGTLASWRCDHLPSGGCLAVKTVSWSKEAKRELRVLVRCRHPGVVQLKGAYREADRVFLCLEYCELGSVAHAVELMGPPKEGIVGCWVAQLLEALEYLHSELKVVHRDIKPGSLLLDGQGRLKVGEFGLASDLSQAAMTLVGSPQYMAPERVTGQAYGFSADIWAVGLCVVFCATGRPPYNEASLWQLVQAVDAGPPPALDPVTYPAPMCDFVQQCVQRDPSQRPSCGALKGHAWLSAVQALPLLEFQATYQAWVEDLRRRRQAAATDAAAGLESPFGKGEKAADFFFTLREPI